MDAEADEGVGGPNRMPHACLSPLKFRPMPTPLHHWHSRGYLPHLESAGRTQAVTFRLADSLPKHAAEEVLRETDDTERRKKMEHFLDAGIGNCLLRSPAAAEKVESVL